MSLSRWHRLIYHAYSPVENPVWGLNCRVICQTTTDDVVSTTTADCVVFRLTVVVRSARAAILRAAEKLYCNVFELLVLAGAMC